MPNSAEVLTNPTTWQGYMARAKTTQEKQEFVLKALTQYEREAEHYDGGMRPSQVVVHPHAQDDADYLLSYHTIRIPYSETRTCTEYLRIMEHEHEHAQQRAGKGYSEEEKKMCDASFAMYPKQIYTPKGLLSCEYAYNYTELRALQAEAEWIHSRANMREQSTLPDYFTPEKKEVLAVLRAVKASIDGRPSVSDAIATNNKNARKAFWGKFNPMYSNGMNGWQVSRTLKHGKKLIKKTMKELKKLSKEIAKDIKKLEKELSPEKEAETFKKEQTKREEYEQQMKQNLPELAKSRGFDIVDKFPTDQSYACLQCNSLHLLQFYLRGFNQDLQYNPAAAGQLHIKEMPHGEYMVMVPKSVADQIKQPEQEPPIVQSILADRGITYDDEISAAAMTEGAR